MKDLRLVKKIVNDYFEINISDKSRKRDFVDARRFYYTLSREIVKNATLTKIGELVKKDHASVNFGIKTLHSFMQYDKHTQNNYLTLKKICLSKLDELGNPFEKYLSKEDKLQHSVMNYLSFEYPSVYAIHVANEGKRSPFERFKFKYLGGKAGVPDILIFRSNGIRNGLAIELKVGYNKPTDSQKESLEKLREENWECHWTNDYDKTIEIIDKYLSLPNDTNT
tara:strand:- start:5925 stop:6596 length:672 start_codon:yes stop_codon:yes gene_type:complete